MRSSVTPGEGVLGVRDSSYNPTDNLLLKVYASQCRLEDQLGKLVVDQRKLMVEKQELASAIVTLTDHLQQLELSGRRDSRHFSKCTGLRTTVDVGKRYHGRGAYHIEEVEGQVPEKVRLNSTKVDGYVPNLARRTTVTTASNEEAHTPQLHTMSSQSKVSGMFRTETENKSSVVFHLSSMGPNVRQQPLKAIAIRNELEVMPPKPHGRASVQELIVNRTVGTSHRSKVLPEIDNDKGYSMPLEPHSKIPLVFNLIGLVMLLHDLLVTPFVIAWEQEVKGILLIFAWCACVFWALDIFMSFITGYYEEGELCLNFRKIARKYVRTWLTADVVLLTIDWITATTSSSELVNTQFFQIARLIRFLKVFRVIKLVRLLEKMSCWDFSLSVQLIIQGVKVVFVTLIVTHILCCLWYMLGKSNMDGTSWIQVAFADSDGVTFRYVTAFQWTVAQVTLGATDVCAQNHLERAFNSLLLIFGMLFGTAVVSSFSAQIVEIIMLARDSTQKVETLRRYIRQRNIPKTLAIKIHNQALERQSKEHLLHEDDVLLLDSLAPMLRRELITATRMPCLLQVALFRLWADIDQWNLRQLCHTATELVFLSPSDDLFVAGTSADEAFCVMSGDLIYQQDPETSWVDESVTKSCGPQSWLCEVALWCEWIHVGNLHSLTSSEIIAVKAKLFFDVVAKSDPIHYLMKNYGHNFYLRVIASVPPHAPWPSDVQVPFTELSELMAADIGVGLLRLAKSNYQLKLSQEEEQQLVDELSRGKCALQKVEGGTLQRCIAVVALEIKRPDGKMLFKVGKKEADGRNIQLDPILPGTKRAMSELPSAALERVLLDLQPFADMMVLTSVREEVESKQSVKYGIQTKYTRTVHAACVDESCEAAGVPMGNTETLDIGDNKMIPMTTVYSIMDHDDKEILYAWLSNHDLMLLSGRNQKQVFDQWMKSLVWSNCISEYAGCVPECSEVDIQMTFQQCAAESEHHMDVQRKRFI